MEIQMVDPNMNRRGSYTNITHVQPQFVHTQPQQLQPVQVVTLAPPPPVERIVEVIKEVPVERIVHEERIVEVPVEKYVEVPVEKIVYQDKPVEKIVYQDRVVEVPVDKIVEVPVDRFVDRIVEVVKEVPVDREVEKVVYRDREVFSVGFGMAIGHRSEDDEHMVVQEIIPGYAADIAGCIRLGDEVLQIDGRQLTNVGQIKSMTIGPAGTRSEVLFRRSGDIFTVILTRTSPAWRDGQQQAQNGGSFMSHSPPSRNSFNASPGGRARAPFQ